MPIYEYRCEQCGNVFEMLQKIDAPSVVDCRYCKDGKAKRILSPAGFILQGEGFYINDYVKKERAKKEKQSSAKTDTSEATTAKNVVKNKVDQIAEKAQT